MRACGSSRSPLSRAMWKRRDAEGRGGEGRGGEEGVNLDWYVLLILSAIFVCRLLRQSATPPDVMESRVKRRKEGREG